RRIHSEMLVRKATTATPAQMSRGTDEPAGQRSAITAAAAPTRAAIPTMRSITKPALSTYASVPRELTPRLLLREGGANLRPPSSRHRRPRGEHRRDTNRPGREAVDPSATNGSGLSLPTFGTGRRAPALVRHRRRHRET